MLLLVPNGLTKLVPKVAKISQQDHKTGRVMNSKIFIEFSDFYGNEFFFLRCYLKGAAKY
jgi:hypothetical protein